MKPPTGMDTLGASRYRKERPPKNHCLREMRPSVRIVAMALAVMALAGLYATTVGHGFILLMTSNISPRTRWNQGLLGNGARLKFNVKLLRHCSG